MSEELNELQNYPKWINSLTKEQQYEWYLRAKEIVVRLQQMGDDSSGLEDAIRSYEKRNSIVS